LCRGVRLSADPGHRDDRWSAANSVSTRRDNQQVGFAAQCYRSAPVPPCRSTNCRAARKIRWPPRSHPRREIHRECWHRTFSYLDILPRESVHSHATSTRSWTASDTDMAFPSIRRMRTLIDGSILPETRPVARQGRNCKRRSTLCKDEFQFWCLYGTSRHLSSSIRIITEPHIPAISHRAFPPGPPGQSATRAFTAKCSAADALSTLPVCLAAALSHMHLP
jgi:hypothetical protein